MTTEGMYGQDSFKDEYNSYKNTGNATYYYVFAISNGKWINTGRFNSEMEAYDHITRKLADRHAEIFPSNSRNISEVHRRFKAMLLSRYHNLDQATSLISRKPAIEKEKSDNPFGKELF